LGFWEAADGKRFYKFELVFPAGSWAKKCLMAMTMLAKAINLVHVPRATIPGAQGVNTIPTDFKIPDLTGKSTCYDRLRKTRTVLEA
jgi:hypothetical protein